MSINPFITKGYKDKEHFCDREIETKQIITNIKSDISTILISPRRLGKTGLIHHVLHQLPKKYSGIYIDILPTENQKELLNTLISSFARCIDEQSSSGAKVWKFIRSLRPVISYDSLTGMPDLAINVRESETEMHITNLLQVINKQSVKYVVAIDEFQQITKYPETNTEAFLRSIFQNLDNIVFIYSGSQQHILSEMFTLPSKPFYRSATLLKLGKIDTEIYTDFIIEKFKIGKKTISKEVVSAILNWTNTHTWYVQMLCNRVFANSNKKVSIEDLKLESHKILKTNETVFYNYRNLLTKPQWSLLKAIAKEGEITAITGNNFIKKHDLGSSATILRSVNSLTESELVYLEYDKEGNKIYSVYDIFLMRWLQG